MIGMNAMNGVTGRWRRAAMTALLTLAGLGLAHSDPPQATLATTTHEAVAPATQRRWSVVMITGVGRSFALGSRRVANLAPPSADLRLGYRLPSAPWLVPEASVGFIAFPELIPTVGLGARLHPFAMTRGVRHGFVRLGGVALANAPGFDAAVSTEVGLAVIGRRLIGQVGLQADRWLAAPRLVVQARLGVGVVW